MHSRRVSDPRLRKRWGRAAKHFNEGVWKANRKYITLVGFYEKFLQNPAMCQHLLNAGDRLLAEASPRDTIWGIGLRADDPDAATPSTWLGENLLGSALQQVRTLLREATPPKTPGASKQGRAANPDAGRIFEIHPDTNKAMAPPPTSTSVWPADTPQDHGPSVMAISAPTDNRRYLPEQGPSLVDGVVTMDDASHTTRVRLHSGIATVGYHCGALLDSGSPASFITSNALGTMLASGAVSEQFIIISNIRSWGGFGSAKALKTSIMVGLTVQFYHRADPSAALAVWCHVVPANSLD